MPENVQALITPAPEVSLEKAMQFIKGGFSFRLKRRVVPMSRRYPVEGAPGPSLLGTGEEEADCGSASTPATAPRCCCSSVSLSRPA
jgi:hypothetical protein